MCIADLKEKGFWIYGLAGEGASNLNTEKFDEPTVFVLGNESTGLREKTRESCDLLLSIPMNNQCESLNAATAMSITMYAWSKEHPEALK
jgi:23S rRNA (guanosine2251-2'-O)-methyltransferase